LYFAFGIRKKGSCFSEKTIDFLKKTINSSQKTIDFLKKTINFAEKSTCFAGFQASPSSLIPIGITTIPIGYSDSVADSHVLIIAISAKKGHKEAFYKTGGFF
jgi:hypothetical protein